MAFLSTTESRTGLIHKTAKPSFSRIREHAIEHNHVLKEEDFSIKFKTTCSSNLMIAESLQNIST